MHRRLLLSSLAVSLATVLLLCIPLGFIAGSLIRDDFNHRLDRNLQNIAASIVELTAQGRTLTAAELTALVPTDRRAIYTPHHGSSISAGKISGHVQTDTTSIPTGVIQMQAPRSLLDQRLIAVWLLIGALGLVVTLIGAVLSRWVAPRLSRPLQSLARAAQRFGDGDLRPSPQRYHITELDSLAAVLDSSAAKLGAALEEERRISIDTAHQLRTPLASLTIRLEEIRRASDKPAIQDEVDAALQQVERLIEVVTEALSGGTRTAKRTALEVTTLLESQRLEWEPTFRRQHRALTFDLSPLPRVLGSAGGLKQVLSTLIENALVHGSGTTHVSGRLLDRHVVIEVSDQGNGIPATLADQIFTRHVSGGGGTGLGLPLARALVEADQGRLQLTKRRPAQFSIFLACADSDTASVSTESRTTVSLVEP